MEKKYNHMIAVCENNIAVIVVKHINIFPDQILCR